MFNGVPDQFHQFGPSLPFPLSFPLHHHQHHHGPMSPSSSSTPSPLQSFPSGCFDLYPPPSVMQLQQSCIAKKEKEEEDAVAAGTGTGTGSSNILATNNNNVAVVLGMEDGVNDDERSMYHHHHHHHHETSSTFDDLWSNDEVVALFKIRSGLQENWFPDFTNWDHVSRKLAELGYQRSAEKCKEKFEEESRQFNDDINYNKNYRFLTELNELYHHVEIPQITPQKNPVSQEQNGEEEKEKKNSTDSAANPCQEIVVEKSVMKKRKRKKSDDNDDDDKFEMFMGFCGNVVKKVIEKQEEMHKKVLEDILKREEESIAREEAWRNQEISNIEKETELRAQEKANASEKEAKMVELLKNFMIPPFDSLEDQSFFKKMQGLFMPSSNYSPQIQDNPQVKITQNPENFSGVNGIVPLSSTLSLQKMEAFEAKDTGKRWPRDEVLALINIRCKLNNISNNNEDKDSPGNKGPLWERISKGMMEMGYKRSAKRCKEKWENINKYFRKTKDIKKKRAEDSRTCPYFQQLSCLYSHQQQENEGLGQSDAPENC